MNKARFFMIGILLLASLFLAACVSPEKDIPGAEKEVGESVLAEKPLLYDNGKNFLVINTGVVSGITASYSIFVVTLQRWVDDNPDKQVIAFSDVEGFNYLWIVYYEDRE